MPTNDPFETNLVKSWPPQAWRDVSVLLAVSGGADSVALLRVMRTLKSSGDGRLLVAHFNHQLRSDESAADEVFVIRLCGELQIPCHTARADTGRLLQASGDSAEAAARTLRYDFLQRTAEQLGARYLVTAHTADDQAETILHRILRGTGIGGLAGMARARPLGPAVTLIRPLLGFRRAELVGYLDRLGQRYRHDSSNDDLRFTRNRIRHQLLPQLAQQYNPEVTGALLRLGAQAGEVQSVVDEIVRRLVDENVSFEPSGSIRIDTAALADQPRYVVREVIKAAWRRRNWPLQAMGLIQWDLLAEMARPDREKSTQTPKKRAFPGNVLAAAGPGGLHLAK